MTVPEILRVGFTEEEMLRFHRRGNEILRVGCTEEEILLD